MSVKNEVALNADAERWVLGLCLLDESGSALDDSLSRLKPEDFGLRQHQLIFSAMKDLSAREEAVDVVTLAECLTRLDDLEPAGGASYLAAITDGVPLVDVVRHIEIVRWYSRRWRIGTWSQRVLSACLDPTTTPDGLEALLEVPADAVATEHTIQRMQDVLASRAEEIRHAASTPNVTPGWQTSLGDLDATTTGIRPSELWVTGAIPGAGKTALLAQIALTNAKLGHAIGIFSLEMSSKGLVDRVLAMESGIHLMKLRDPRLLTRDDLEQLDGGIHRLQDTPIYFDETPGLALSALRARARLMVRKHGCQLIFVDFLQLVEAEGDSRRERVAAVARGLKNLAKELEIGVVVASQLARPQRGTAQLPTMLDLKESGDIEAAADTILLIHRPFVLSHKQADRAKDQIIIGSRGTALLETFRSFSTRLTPGSCEVG